MENFVEQLNVVQKMNLINGMDRELRNVVVIFKFKRRKQKIISLV